MLAAIFNQSLIDWLEDAKWLFVGVYVLSTIGVIVGVYWEGEHFDKATQDRGWRLLLVSLASDTLFTIMIFAADGGISHIQRGEIIMLETKIAPRVISDPDLLRITEAVKPFSGTPFVFGTEPTAECLVLLQQIGGALKAAGWKWQRATGTVSLTLAADVPAAMLSITRGVIIQIAQSKDATWGAGIGALVKALRDAGIATSGIEVQGDAIPPDAVQIIVGDKP